MAMHYKRIPSWDGIQWIYVLLFLLLASATAAAQKNELSVQGVGNFNPVTYVYINQAIPTMGSSQKSSVGGGAEYDRWFSRYQAFGLRFELNPSDGKLHGAANGLWYIWPQMRYEFIGMFTEQFNGNHEQIRVRKVTPFIQEGAGAVVTQEYGDDNRGRAGWSHSLAYAAGTGSDYWVNNKFAVRLSAVMMADETGCYDDPTCRPTWGVSHDFDAGLVWKW